jgi:hypothetical protein
VIEVEIARWAGWLPGVETPEAWRTWATTAAGAGAPHSLREPASPSAAEVPALLRRRCDALSRALLHVAGACCEPALRGEVATVFATRFGPLGAITENLEALAANAAISPTTFAHAVHNTALGLYSIWAKNRAPGSALAAGEGTFAHGWLEAALLLNRERARPVLLVAGDAALPSALTPAASAASGAHAVALLLRGAGARDGNPERVRFGLAPHSAATASAHLPPPLAFLRWWIARDEPALTLASEGRAFRWQRA